MSITDLINSSEGINATLNAIVSSATDTWNMVLKLLGVSVSIAIVVAITLAIRAFLRKTLKPRVALHVYNVIEKVIVYAVLILGIMAALAPLGINLTGLLVAGGVAAVIIGFASQTVFSNFLSGVFLYIERPVKIGDSVIINTQDGPVSGVVIDIDAISTKIRSWNGHIVRIPNDRLFSSTIINVSKVAAVRVVVDVSISYKSDVVKAKEAILEALNEHPYVLVNPQPEVYIKEFGNSAIILRVRFWAPSKVWYETRKVCLELIRDRLKKVGVEIPFPQLDLHVKEPINIVEVSSDSSKA